MKKPFSGQGKTIRTLWGYLGRNRILLILSVLFAAGSVVLTLYVPLLVGDAIDQMIDGNTGITATIFPILCRIGIAIALTALLQWLMSVFNQKITYRILCDLRRDAFAHLQTLPLSYLDSHPVGDTTSRIITDVEQLGEGLLLGFTQFATGVFTILGTLIFMLLVHPAITVVVVVLTPLSLFIASFIAKKTYHLFRRQSEVRAEQSTLMEEMVKERKTVSAFHYEDQAIRRFEEINDRLQDCSVKASFFSSLTNPSTRVVNALVYAGVALTGAFAAIGGSLTVGQLSVFLSYANRYTKPFNEISSVMTELQNSLACAARVFEILHAPSQIPDAPDARILTDVKGEVELSHVCFSYRPDQTLLQDVNLTVRPGQRVAIVGPTGCGKTTLINLLMRFYELNSGKIQVDGHPIDQVTRESLRQNYGMVLQETWLKHATVRENLTMGKPDAKEEEIISVAKAAYAHGFISRLPKGYDTVLGEDGSSLSQGQKQLLCIARVMLCLPPMLILDEATSSIDTRTEAKIQAAFSQMMQGRTSFIVAHRLTTICDADVILVMKDGQIIEQGNHETLLAKNGFYAELYRTRLQSAAEE